MKIIVWSTSNWNNPEQAAQRNPWLNVWRTSVEKLFKPAKVIVACGSWSDPKLIQWIYETEVLNSGLPLERPYDIWSWHYWAAAATTACARLAQLHQQMGWDVAVLWDNDTYLGDIDLNQLLNEFLGRKEILACGSWCNVPGGGLYFWKIEAVQRFIHERRRPNLCRDAALAKKLPLLENEVGDIFKGVWWNPWPKFPNTRQDGNVPDSVCKTWPMVDHPNPGLRQWFIENKHPTPVA